MPSPYAGSFSAPQLHKPSPEPLFHTAPRMRPGVMAKHVYLQHVAFAFIAGGLLTYLCVTFLGNTGTTIVYSLPDIHPDHAIAIS